MGPSVVPLLVVQLSDLVLAFRPLMEARNLIFGSALKALLFD
jgi:hypothetical protein